MEEITHGETPWKNARINCLPGEPSNEVISKDSIKEYFLEVADKYGLDNVGGIKQSMHGKEMLY